MTKRGVDLGGEFRYLERDYQGELRANYMPDDRLRESDRWGYALRHDGIVGSGLPIGAAGPEPQSQPRQRRQLLARFLPRSPHRSPQRLLANDGVLHWGRGDFSFMARALKWQTLQDVSSPIVPPYDRLPQLVGRHARDNLAGGLESYVETDYTKFAVGPAAAPASPTGSAPSRWRS